VCPSANTSAEWKAQFHRPPDVSIYEVPLLDTVGDGPFVGADE
jgi:hypothetical protein